MFIKQVGQELGGGQGDVGSPKSSGGGQGDVGSLEELVVDDAAIDGDDVDVDGSVGVFGPRRGPWRGFSPPG